MGSIGSKVYPYKMININNYWIGPYGIIISNDINRVKDPDQCNFILKPGNIRTNAYTTNTPLTKEEYMSKYATLFPNNKYYFNLTEEILNEIEVIFIRTKNKKGDLRVYRLMTSGQIFIETTHYSKTLFPINPVTKKPIIQ
jgi:hypothetical protein